MSCQSRSFGHTPDKGGLMPRPTRNAADLKISSFSSGDEGSYKCMIYSPHPVLSSKRGLKSTELRPTSPV